MSERTIDRLAVFAMTIFTLDAVAHLIWATGVRWPADDTRALSEAVLGAQVPFTVRTLVPLALLLLAAAATVGAWVRGGREHRFGALFRAGTWLVAVGVSARAFAGVIWAFGVGTSIHEPFYWLNLALYTPLCLALGFVVFILASHDVGKNAKFTPTRIDGEPVL